MAHRFFLSDDVLLSVARASFGTDWFTATDLGRKINELHYNVWAAPRASHLTTRLNALAGDYSQLACFKFGYTVKQFKFKE